MIPTSAFALGAQTIRRFEGFRAAPYWDAAGKVWSIAFGMCTGPDGSPVTQHTPPVTYTQALAMLAAKLGSDYAPAVANACQGATLPDAAWAAMLSLCWNIGPGAFAKSGIGQLVAAGNLRDAAARLRRYVYAHGQVVQGLVTRRAAEAIMLLGASPLSVPSTRAPAPALSEAERLNQTELDRIRSGQPSTADLNDAEYARIKAR